MTGGYISGVNNCKLADPVAVKYPVKPDETLMSRFRSETKVSYSGVFSEVGATRLEGKLGTVIVVVLAAE
jgi:hypothetical protein